MQDTQGDDGIQVILVEVYRATRRAACEERALVLTAVGIASEIDDLRDGWALLVQERFVAEAAAHLQAYGDENRRRELAQPPPLPPLHLHEDAWLGAAAYGILLIGIAHLASASIFGADWYTAGDLIARKAIAGQWWRAVTALTLHADSAHLIANLGFGVLFGYLLGQLIGPGVAWASVIATGAIGNVTDALIMPAAQRVIGASTAVFATLGLLAAYSWRRRRARWAYRWSPLIAAGVLLTLTGTGGERTDVFAHASGFLSGALLGAVYGRLATPLAERRRLQRICAAAALLAIVIAWTLALRASTMPVQL
jgi:rhomboid protease GluP